MAYDRKAYKKQYDLDHKEEKNAKSKAYYAANREIIQEKHKKHYQKHKAEIQAQRRTKVLASPKSQAARHAAVKRWQRRNPEKARIIATNAARDRRARKKSQFVESVKRDVVYEMHGGMCGICEGFIDRNSPEALGYIAKGKSWFHVDHIIPLSKNGSHSYINVQPAHPKCNLTKKDKII